MLSTKRWPQCNYTAPSSIELVYIVIEHCSTFTDWDRFELIMTHLLFIPIFFSLIGHLYNTPELALVPESFPKSIAGLRKIANVDKDIFTSPMCSSLYSKHEVINTTVVGH